MKREYKVEEISRGTVVRWVVNVIYDNQVWSSIFYPTREEAELACRLATAAYNGGWQDALTDAAQNAKALDDFDPWWEDDK